MDYQSIRFFVLQGFCFEYLSTVNRIYKNRFFFWNLFCCSFTKVSYCKEKEQLVPNIGKNEATVLALIQVNSIQSLRLHLTCGYRN